MRIHLRAVAENQNSRTLVGFKRRLDFKGPLLQLAHELTVCNSGALRRLHTNGDSLKRKLKWHRPLTPTSEASVLRYTRCQSALQSLTQVFLRWTVWKDGDLKRQSRSTHCAITIKPSHTNSHSDLSGLASDTICIPDALRGCPSMFKRRFRKLSSFCAAAGPKIGKEPLRVRRGGRCMGGFACT